MDLVGGVGALDALPGASGRARPSSTLAKGAKQFDPAAGAPESGCDFLADWNASLASQIARKIARLAQRQAQNAQRAAPSSQKGRFCHPNHLKFT